MATLVTVESLLWNGLELRSFLICHIIKIKSIFHFRNLKGWQILLGRSDKGGNGERKAIFFLICFMGGSHLSVQNGRWLRPAVTEPRERKNRFYVQATSHSDNLLPFPALCNSKVHCERAVWSVHLFLTLVLGQQAVDERLDVWRLRALKFHSFTLHLHLI